MKKRRKWWDFILLVLVHVILASHSNLPSVLLTQMISSSDRITYIT
jgi:hypothetical protein